MGNVKIKKELPHGSVKAIAEKTGFSTSTICQILKGQNSPKKAIVLTATAEYLAEYKAKEFEAMQAFNQVLNQETPAQLINRRNHQRERHGNGSSPLL